MIARLILASMLAATMLSAQRGGGGGGGRGRGGDTGSGMQMPPSQNRLDLIESMFKLNKDQKKQVKTIMDEGQKEAAPVRDQIVQSESDLGDAISEGKQKALIILSHVPSEQAGMEECVRWMKTFVSEVPVEFVPAPDPFAGHSTLLR